MKVLWFTPTPANADTYFNTDLKGSGGWLKALDQDLQHHVDLHVAFLKKHEKSFGYQKTTYHPVYAKRSVGNKWLRKFSGQQKHDKLIQKSMDIVNAVKPDIIHIHGSESIFTAIAPHTDIPLVLSIQGNITVYLHKFFSGIEKKYLHQRSGALKKPLQWLKPAPFAYKHKIFKHAAQHEQLYLRHIKNFIGRTDWDRRISLIMAPHRKYFVVNEFMREAFYENQWQPHPTEKTIIHTTNDNNYFKGFETLCHALHLLQKNGIHAEWRVAGIKEDDLIVKIVKRKLKDKFPKKDLILLGALNEKNLIERMLQADIYVMPSHIENSPNSLCEAMMLGMPCISTVAGGTPSLMTDKHDGILIQSGDPYSMAGAIAELSEDREKAAALGRKARLTAMLRHDKKTIIKNLIQVYNTCIKN